ncbi:hypothetical protein SERLADRAFT_479700 [Serpula lacrymans var. lacrymans S7.9]|uniref:Uncharacterized protein n=1 Tax=Serpula lacrymans var. lacrymans (strain S7.9) TaxID=578457 RepID=F8PC97_SERL9|nr:uncharacterized protein SERLADRAFT_479700 [Serpula lacrymans var. lacrymans S7.9]EGO19297.1 hypothetical protein SERLADRAFT_479700 [Serpula lacrymans var. lacrymans S7.9]
MDAKRSSIASSWSILLSMRVNRSPKDVKRSFIASSWSFILFSRLANRSSNAMIHSQLCWCNYRGFFATLLAADQGMAGVMIAIPVQ